MCIVLRGQDGVVEQARRQLEDLVPVWAVLDYTNTKVIERELMLVKVSILGPEYFEESQYGYTGGSSGTGNVPPELLAERESDSAASPKSVGGASEAKAVAATTTGAAAPLSPTEALRVKSDNMRTVIALAEQFRGRVVDVSSNSVIVEVSGKSSRCDAFLKLVRPFGVLECARSGEYDQRPLFANTVLTLECPSSIVQEQWSFHDRLSHPLGPVTTSSQRTSWQRSMPVSFHRAERVL